MSVEDIIQQRQVKEIMHFTTHNGLVGILDSKYLKSRERLNRDQRLEFILKLNTPRVLDPRHVDYVNLSISKINSSLYGISSTRWHLDVWWCILAFDPVVLTHQGVYFVTTNNAYPSARRATGSAGLEALFSPEVKGRYSERIVRQPSSPRNLTTCPQAEVLYPGQLSTDYLKTIYVKTGEDKDDVMGQMRALNHRAVDVIVDPDKF